ncbi:MAG: hypothetical protein F4Z92_01780 [Gemmatimonadetes bacterium]|nr:hypothetical protein [Gemmatimonadota bacterium]
MFRPGRRGADRLSGDHRPADGAAARAGAGYGSVAAEAGAGTRRRGAGRGVGGFASLTAPAQPPVPR